MCHLSPDWFRRVHEVSLRTSEELGLRITMAHVKQEIRRGGVPHETPGLVRFGD